jgi:metal transporter CNNM
MHHEETLSILLYVQGSSDMPYYDMHNEFQKGSSHMAAVVRAKPKVELTSKKTEPNMDAIDTQQLPYYLMLKKEQTM